MAYGISGSRDSKCGKCGSEWYTGGTSWYYDPKEGRVTSETPIAELPEWHEESCPRSNGVSYSDAKAAQRQQT